MSDVKKVEFDATTKVATVTMKSGKTIEKKDAEAAFDGSQYGVSSFAEAEKKKKKKKAA